MLMFSAAAVLAAVFAAPAGAAAGEGPETVEVRSGTVTLRGLLWLPKGDGPFPAVLFNHGSGTNSDLSRAGVVGPVFARHGDALLYLYRRGSGLSADQGRNSGALLAQALAQGGQEARNALQLKLQETELSDAAAGITFLRGRSDVDGKRIAVAGHSFGGQLALLLAERDADLRAAVLFGAAAASWEKSPPLRERLLAAVGRVRAPVFFIHAANDVSTAPGKTLAAELKRLGKPHLVEIYPAEGQTPAEGHAFFYTGVATWEKDVFTFLEEHLRR